MTVSESRNCRRILLRWRVRSNVFQESLLREIDNSKIFRVAAVAILRDNPVIKRRNVAD